MPMDLPADLFVRPVSDHTDLVAFNFPFALQGKALQSGGFENVVSELDDGDLLIEGWAAEFDGEDRQGENFTDGAFQRGIKSFLSNGSSALCWHHKHDKVLGKVLNLEEVEGKGLKMRARVDGAIKDHPELGTIYRQIKNGTLTSLSVGGFFKRVKTSLGTRINDMDFTEISVTGVPVHTKPAFSIIAGKALEDFEVGDTFVSANIESVFDQLSSSLDALSAALPEGKSVKPTKGNFADHRALATVLKMHQMAGSLPDSNDADGDEAYVNPKVAKLGEDVREHLKTHAKTAHELAAKLGPIPANAEDGYAM